MEAFKENNIVPQSSFPMDVFISDNSLYPIKAHSHWHDYIELLYILEGTAVQQVNGKYFNVQKNDLIILNSGDIHSTESSSDEVSEILVIQFLPEVISTSYSNIFESKYILTFLNNHQNQNYHIADTFSNSKDIFRLMMGIHGEFVQKRTGYEIFIKGYIYQLIAHLLRSDMLELYKPNIQEKDLKRIDPLLKFIETHFSEEINLEKAANMLNFNYYYFSHFFKKITGKNYKEYIDFIRVCEAEKLLLSQNVSIAQAALEVGFSNVSSFNRMFKRIRGYSPMYIKKAKTAKK